MGEKQILDIQNAEKAKKNQSDELNVTPLKAGERRSPSGALSHPGLKIDIPRLGRIER